MKKGGKKGNVTLLSFEGKHEVERRVQDSVFTIAATALASELLPPRLREFVRLIERYGGLRIYIPAAPSPDHPLASLIGFDKLRALSAEYAIDGTGLRFVLPKAQRAFDAIRNDRIRTDFSTGKSVRALAAEHHLVERQVARIVADIAY